MVYTDKKDGFFPAEIILTALTILVSVLLIVVTRNIS